MKQYSQLVCCLFSFERNSKLILDSLRFIIIITPDVHIKWGREDSDFSQILSLLFENSTVYECFSVNQ